MRFGRWKAVLEWPEPPDAELYAATVVQRHYARGLAFAALGDVEAAVMAQTEFFASLSVPSFKTRRVVSTMYSFRKFLRY